MKYLEIRIRRGDWTKGENQMVYPSVYDPYEVEAEKLGPILYPDEIGRGEDQEHCIICIKNNEVAARYIEKGAGDIRELTEADVNDYMANRWEGRHRSLAVSAPNIIQAIQTKIQAGIELTDTERAALDPDNRESGLHAVNKDCNIFFHRYKADNGNVAALKRRWA